MVQFLRFRQNFQQVLESRRRLPYTYTTLKIKNYFRSLSDKARLQQVSGEKKRWAELFLLDFRAIAPQSGHASLLAV
jgi:hypothetical protein